MSPGRARPFLLEIPQVQSVAATIRAEKDALIQEDVEGQPQPISPSKERMLPDGLVPRLLCTCDNAVLLVLTAAGVMATAYGLSNGDKLNLVTPVAVLILASCMLMLNLRSVFTTIHLLKTGAVAKAEPGTEQVVLHRLGQPSLYRRYYGFFDHHNIERVTSMLVAANVARTKSPTVLFDLQDSSRALVVEDLKLQLSEDGTRLLTA